MLSHKESYLIAIRGLIYFARFESNVYIQAKEIANHLRINTKDLTRVFRVLVDKQILSSIPGPSGGYILTKPVQTISLYDIKEAAKDEEKPPCILGIYECREHCPCSIHKFWQEARIEIDDKLKKTSLKDAYNNMKEKQEISISMDNS